MQNHVGGTAPFSARWSTAEVGLGVASAFDPGRLVGIEGAEVTRQGNLRNAGLTGRAIPEDRS